MKCASTDIYTSLFLKCIFIDVRTEHFSTIVSTENVHESLHGRLYKYTYQSNNSTGVSIEFSSIWWRTKDGYMSRLHRYLNISLVYQKYSSEEYKNAILFTNKWTTLNIYLRVPFLCTQIKSLELQDHTKLFISGTDSNGILT